MSEQQPEQDEQQTAPNGETPIPEGQQAPDDEGTGQPQEDEKPEADEHQHNEPQTGRRPDFVDAAQEDAQG